MKATVKINGQEIEIEINEEQLEQLKIKKKTGYEKVNKKGKYYNVETKTVSEYYHNTDFDDIAYENANYYSDKTVAENNSRADKLFRQLRRFAVENRKEELYWESEIITYFTIVYRHFPSIFGEKIGLEVSYARSLQDFGSIYFDSRETAQKAIETFYDELIWYFTEYKDSL